jgi:hypothetical protein
MVTTQPLSDKKEKTGGDTIVLDVDPSWFLASFSETSDDPHSGEYTCSGDTLFLTSNPLGAVQFNRVE